MLNDQSAKRHLAMLATAFGPVVRQLLEDKNIIEIMLNPDGKLWAESLIKGKFFTDTLIDPAQSANIIKLAATAKQMIADENNPEISTELPGSGERFQGWLPPVVTNPTFTIRKQATRVFSLDDYLAAKSIDSDQVRALRDAIKMRKNILIAGGTGSGKTTFANALLHELKDSKDRIIVLEDLPELQVLAEDLVTLKTCAQKTMRDLVRGILRMRPDRIIIGEVRDAAALELLKAWNTGHPGGICTIHANSPEATIARLEDLIHEAVSVVPTRLIKEAIDIIVFMRRDNKVGYKVDKIEYYN